MAFELITSKGQFPSGGLALPQPSDDSATAAALKQAGAVVGGIGEQIREAQKHTQKSTATTEYLKGIDGLEQKYSRDQDFATIKDRATGDEQALRERTLGTISDPETRAAAEVQLTRTGLAFNSGIRTTALSKEVDHNKANLDTQGQLLLQKATRAPTPVQTQGHVNEFNSSVDGLVKTGMLTEQQGVERKRGFATGVEDARALNLIQNDPQAAMAALKDPKQFPTLDPSVREARIAAAQNRIDDLGTQKATATAQFNPAAGLAMAGRLTSKDQIPFIIDKALIPQESGGNTNAVSPKGAGGITQFMPDTARMVARQMGNDIFEGEDDRGVRGILAANPGLARAMSVKHFGDLVARYNGQLAPAFAAYHAGSGSGDIFHKAAVKQFGENYSPAQLMSVIPDSYTDGKKLTRDYVGDMFKRLGADPNGMGLSPAGAYRAATAAGGAVNQELSEQKRVTSALASVARDDADGQIGALKSGYAQDAMALAQTRSSLMAAAQGGDAASARKLRDMNFAEQIAPIVRDAYQLAPAKLEALVAAEDSRLRSAGHVTPFERQRYDAMKAVSSEIAAQRNVNPTGLYERASGRQAAEFPVQGPLGGPEQRAQFAQLGNTAIEAADHYGAPVLPFKPQVAEAMKERWNGAGHGEKFELLRGMAAEMPARAYEAALKQITGGDQLAMTAGMLGKTNPELGRSILKGQALLELPGVKPKAEEVRAALLTKLPAGVYPPEVSAQLIEASLAKYVSDRNGKSALFEPGDSAAMERAVEGVVGQMAKRGDARYPLPTGMKPAQAEFLLDGLKDADLGGALIGADGKPLDMGFVRSRMRLRPMDVGEGRYRIMLPGAHGEDATVRDANGRPAILDLRALAKGKVLPGAGDTAGDTRRQTIVDGVQRQSENGVATFGHTPGAFSRERLKQAFRDADMVPGYPSNPVGGKP